MNLSGKLSALGSEKAKYIPIYTFTPYIYCIFDLKRHAVQKEVGEWKLIMNNKITCFERAYINIHECHVLSLLKH